MTEKDLMNAMSDIREEYILEAAPDNPPSKVLSLRPGQTRILFTAGLAAACCMLFLGIRAARLKNLPPAEDTAAVTQLDETSPLPPTASRPDTGSVADITGSALQSGAANEFGAYDASPQMDAANELEASNEDAFWMQDAESAEEDAFSGIAQEYETAEETEAETESETESESQAAAK